MESSMRLELEAECFDRFIDSGSENCLFISNVSFDERELLGTDERDFWRGRCTFDWIYERRLELLLLCRSLFRLK